MSSEQRADGAPDDMPFDGSPEPEALLKTIEELQAEKADLQDKHLRSRPSPKRGARSPTRSGGAA